MSKKGDCVQRYVQGEKSGIREYFLSKQDTNTGEIMDGREQGR